MRNEVKLHLENGIATLREIRPIDVMLAITVVTLNKDVKEVIDNEKFSEALLTSDLISYPKSISDTENKLINETFQQLNRAYFDVRNTGYSANQFTVAKLTTLANTLNQDCAYLIYRHHLNCWHYGWQFFLTAKDQFKE